MADTGWLVPGGIITANYTGSFVSIDNSVLSTLQTLDGVYATATRSGSGSGDMWIGAAGFNASVPAGATINGYEVRLTGHQTGTTTVPTVSICRDYAAVVAVSKTSTFASSDSAVTYGSPTDLWGTAYTVAQVNGSAFCIFTGFNYSSSVTQAIDLMELRITYTLAAAGGVKNSLMMMGMGV